MSEPKRPDVRFVFANTLGFTMSDNDAKIVFMIGDDPSDAESALPQIGVAMTHRTLKLLGVIATEAIAHFEKTSGQKVPFEEGRREALIELFDQAAAQAAAKRAITPKTDPT